MNTPKKKEVIKYFENAKEVACLCNGKSYDISENITRDFYEWNNGFWIDTHIDIKVWDETHGYAKILSYKEPKEKTYKITREQIKEIYGYCNSTELQNTVKEWFPEVFETKLEAGEWYKSLEHPKQIIFASDIKDVQHIKGYGFNTRGDWESCDDRFSWGLPTDGSYIEAPEQEVTEALTKEAVKRGYKEGVYMVDMYNGESEKDTILVSSNRFDWEPIGGGKNQGQMALRDSCGNIIFHNGQFAEIIPTLTIQQAEAKLKEIGVNAKIV